MKHGASSPVSVILLFASLIVVFSVSFHPGGMKDGDNKMLNRVKNKISEPWSRHTVSKGWPAYWRSSWLKRKYKYRSKSPWKQRKLTTNPPKKITNVPKATTPVAPTSGREICRNHARVSRIQDEPGSVVCLRRTSEELLKQLESAGGFLKRYVAVNESDASKFEDLTTFQNGGPNTSKKSRNLRVKEKPRAVKFKSDLRYKRNSPTATGTEIRRCEERGTNVDDTNLHRLCTECAATTHLGEDKFPKFINEVICDDKDHQCAAKMGQCFQRTLHLSFLRFVGVFEEDRLLSARTGRTVYKEVWETYTQEIRSCCECEMYPGIYRRIASRGGGDGDSDEEDSDADEEEDYSSVNNDV